MIFANVVCYLSIAICVHKRILNGTITSDIEVCFIQMQWFVGTLICIFKAF